MNRDSYSELRLGGSCSELQIRVSCSELRSGGSYSERRYESVAVNWGQAAVTVNADTSQLQ